MERVSNTNISLPLISLQMDKFVLHVEPIYKILLKYLHGKLKGQAFTTGL